MLIQFIWALLATDIPVEPVNSIMNKYLGQGKPGAIKCAAELIKAGFKDNARW
jgi:hypothetical protein